MELMQRPAEQARAQPWLDPLFDCSTPLTVDPRQVAQRIMDIRVQIARELQQDLNKIEEENMEMLRQSLMLSLEAQSTCTYFALFFFLRRSNDAFYEFIFWKKKERKKTDIFLSFSFSPLGFAAHPVVPDPEEKAEEEE